MSRFSIIIPVFNGAADLRPCLDSICNQTVSDWECICVDDGSTDGSGTVLDDFAKRDSRFRIFHQPNSGVSMARNRGLQMAVGDIVCFVDADDVVEPDWLESYARAFEDREVDVVRLPGSDPWSLDGFPWKYAVRRAIAVKAEFPVGVAMSEDGIYVARLLPFVHKVARLERMTYRHLEHPDSAMRRFLASAERLKYLQALLDLVRNNPDQDHEIISRMCAEGVLSWLGRPKDIQEKRSIRAVWMQLRQKGCAKISVVRPLLRLSYALYAIIGSITLARCWLVLIYGLVAWKNELRTK